MIARTAEIKLTIDLDADNLPVHIEWEATEAGDGGPASCKSMMLSLWDSEKQTMAAINLWTKDTSVEEMNLYFYQVFHKLADTYQRATQNKETAATIHEFGDEFGNSLGLFTQQQHSGTDTRRM
jgi:gliding motility-associated protein GldC